MAKLPLPRIIATDRFLGDLLIVFHDNRTVLFSAAFLYEAIPSAHEVLDVGSDDYIDARQDPGGDYV